MKKEEFLNLLLAIMNEKGINKINVEEISETVKIIYSSKEFSELIKILDIRDLRYDDVIDNKYVNYSDENGFIEFSIPEEEIKGIKERNQNVIGLIKTAFIKREIAKNIELITEGVISFKYDDPDGIYNLPYINNPMNECETCMFTDGTIKMSEIKPGNGLYTKSRDIEIENSTYAIMADYQNKKIVAIEIRAISCGDFNLIAQEAKNILYHQTNGYDIVNDEKPKTYKFKRH